MQIITVAISAIKKTFQLHANDLMSDHEKMNDGQKTVVMCSICAIVILIVSVFGILT